MTLVQKILVFALLILTISSCYKDEVVSTETIDVVEAERIYLNTIKGQVLDTLGQPVSSALVEMDDKAEMTDDEGRFALEDIMVPNTGAFISVTHPGYYDGGIRVYATAPMTQIVQVNIVPKGTTYNFSNSQGASIAIGNLAKVSIPPSTFIKDYSTYQGMVTLEVYLMNPSEVRSFNKRIQVFESYNREENEPIQKTEMVSLIYIEAYDEDDHSLEIETGKLVNVSLPLYGTSLSNVNLFAFNETIGFWQNEGEVEVSDNLYTAELEHFSWWGVGKSVEAEEKCILFESDSPSSGQYFTLTLTNGTLVQSGAVNYEDQVCYLSPLNSTLELRIFNECFIQIYAQSIENSSEKRQIIKVEPEETKTLVEIEVVDCDITQLQDSVSVIYTTDLSSETVGTGVGTFDFELDQCFSQQLVTVVVTHDVGNTRYTYEQEIFIEQGVPQYNIQVVACQDVMPIEGYLTLNGITYSDVVARQNEQETLIVARDGDEEVILGFDGFNVGTFPGRVISFGSNLFCEGKVSVSYYGELGDFIEGDFNIPEDESMQCEAISGEFRAFREN